jgi:hypothetical protein
VRVERASRSTLMHATTCTLRARLVIGLRSPTASQPARCAPWRATYCQGRTFRRSSSPAMGR